ncbi:hypothetical protein [Arthrobacter psychrochitiniphilus]|uniref:hypothetical protein n=1 Tax=Arthrobacter psychrochitiniphilus TaxID=291045 RepID=UPI0015CDD894|nr:hypothetical protein [Arthrobacter psychrochitiniphilus]NYG18168.1 hypothetical protein [Arthrobacter psychrochitiniphilus]
MSNYNGAPPPPANAPIPGGPMPQQGPGNRKTLFIVVGAAVVAVVLVVVVVLVWVLPSFTQSGNEGKSAPTVAASQSASNNAGRGSGDAPSEAATPTGPGAGNEPSDGAVTMPEGAVALPQGWDALEGPTEIPAEGDPLFSKFVTGESSFQYLKAWDYDTTFGKTTDPETGTEMQQVAQGTKDLDADGISTAFAFFAESDEGKHGSDPATVKAAIKATQSKLAGASTTELTQQLVGHKCASDFTSSTPAIQDFRRGQAVVISFSCKSANGEDIQAINLFSVTPWGTPQRVGVSGHKSYWDANPGVFEKLGNSYRINRWKL